MKLWKKFVLGTATAVLVVALGVGGTVLGLWHDEIKSMATIEKLEDADPENRSGPLYTIDVSGGYYFDKFLEQGGARNDQELIDFLVQNLTKGIVPIELEAPTVGCSSFTFQTPEGERYFARNYDFSPTTSMIVRTAPGDGRHASVSSADLQFLGITDCAEITSFMEKCLALVSPYVPLDGINDAGVSCGIYMSYQKDVGEDGQEAVVSTDQNSDLPDLTSTTMLRMILDYADDVDEAVSLVRQYDFHDSASTSFHYMVADRTGRSAILEWVAGKDGGDDGTKRELKVYYNDQDDALEEGEGKHDFQYITNFLVTPGYYEGRDDSRKGGYDRYLHIQERIDPDGTNPEGVFTEEQALDLLQELGRRRWDAQHGGSDSNSITVWSSLYNLTTGEVTWVSNERFDDPDHVYHLAFPESSC